MANQTTLCSSIQQPTRSRTIAEGGTPFSARLSPDGRWLLVGEDNDSKGKLEAIDVQDIKVRHSFDVDRLPLT